MSDSLRTQILEALSNHHAQFPWSSHEDLFDVAIMPILQKAMDAGELLVSKNTGPRIPVPIAVANFLFGLSGFKQRLQPKEATVSKRELLSMIYHLSDSAEQAYNDLQATMMSIN